MDMCIYKICQLLISLNQCSMYYYHLDCGAFKVKGYIYIY